MTYELTIDEVKKAIEFISDHPQLKADYDYILNYDLVSHKRRPNIYRNTLAQNPAAFYMGYIGRRIELDSDPANLDELYYKIACTLISYLASFIAIDIFINKYEGKSFKPVLDDYMPASGVYNDVEYKDSESFQIKGLRLFILDKLYSINIYVLPKQQANDLTDPLSFKIQVAILDTLTRIELPAKWLSGDTLLKLLKDSNIKPL